MLLNNLHESQTQLQHTQGALTEQHKHVVSLTERINSLKRVCNDKELDAEETEKRVTATPSGRLEYQVDMNGLEILECKYKVAVTEVIDLKAELKALKEKYNQSVENQSDELSDSEGKLQSLCEHVTTLEREGQESRERIVGLEAELRRATSMASDCQGTLNAAQDELVTFSEELAQLYHHVCLCNNETPNRVMLDYYRQSRITRGSGIKGSDGPRALLSPRLARRLAAVNSDASRSPHASPQREATLEVTGADTSPSRSPFGSPIHATSSSLIIEAGGDLRKEPLNIYNLNAIIRDQIKHLQKAVDRSLQLSRQRAAARELAPIFDKDKEACMEDILKLKSLLSSKREQIATLRLVLKANKQVIRFLKA